MLQTYLTRRNSRWAANRMKYRLLLTDLDGTLLTGTKLISPRTKAVLMKKQEQGLTLALASGRCVRGMMPFAQELRLKEFCGYVLAFNGGRLLECATGKIVRNVCIPDEIVVNLYHLARRGDCDLVTYSDNEAITNNVENPWVRYEALCNDLALRTTEDFSEFAQIRLNKCLMAGRPEDIGILEEEATTAFGTEMEFFRSEPFFLECMPKGVNKGSSLEFLAGLLNISIAETMACGDGYNDLAMISRAGLGVAMANAQDEVRAGAQYVTGSNEEDGLALAVERFCV